MVSISLSAVINNLRHTIANGLFRRRQGQCQQQQQQQQQQQNKSVRVLYPRLLMKHQRCGGVVIDTLAAAQYLSSTTKSVGDATAASTYRPTGLDTPVTPQYRPPRAPIVLCHGLYGFDRRGPASIPRLQIRYWGGVEEALARLGAKVIVTKVPRTGSIVERAQELHSVLTSILAGKPLNFVAHSMGGLDCRLLLSHIRDRPYHAQSLTTISTPHQGSPVMDWFRDRVGVGVTYCHHHRRRLGRQPRFFDSVLKMVDTPAYANLTTDYCRNHFNPNTPDDPTVAYYSYGADGTMIPPWTFLGLTWQLVHAKEGKNDGIVSVESAKWGKYIKTLDASHWELNGERPMGTNKYSLRSAFPSTFLDAKTEEGEEWRRRKGSTSSSRQKRFDATEFYIELATLLYEQGH